MGRRRAIGITNIAAGIGLGATGLFLLPAGIAGLALAIGAPLYDYFESRRIIRTEHKSPLESTAFRLSKVIRDHVPKLAKSQNIENVDISAFYERIRTKYSYKPSVNLCLAQTSSGALCTRQAKTGEYFCWQHGRD